MGVWIDKDTQDLAAPGKTDNVEPQEKTVLHDPFSDYCVDCAHDKSKPTLVK
jgi:hypothetical protein